MSYVLNDTWNNKTKTFIFRSSIIRKSVTIEADLGAVD